MSNVFPKWTNRLPLLVLVGGVLLGGGVVTGVTYYFTPKYTRVGYQPVQPVSFSHKTHAGELGMDCRFCHNMAEKSWFSNIPAASTCMKCHSTVLAEDPRLAPVRDSFYGEDTNHDGELQKDEDKNQNGKNDRSPIPWVQIHKTPDYVYFDHSVHVTRGISCVKCHGRVDQMDEVRHAKSMSMGFCLECHRNAHENVRPLDKVTDLDWKGGSDPHGYSYHFVDKTDGASLTDKLGVRASESCSVCHR
jgi:hypothetical protein